MTSQTILIVDDQREVADGIAEALAHDGCNVVVCYDAESAQLVVETTPVSAVVSDIRLTGPFRFEGLDFLDHLARHAPTARVALVSGAVTPELESESLRRGATAVLQKPFEIEELERVLGRNGDHPHGAGTLLRFPTIDEIISSGVIRSRFQPIVHLSSEKAIGFEALASLTGESFLGSSPELLFRYAERKQRLTALEVACIAQAFESAVELLPNALLFMNIHPGVLADGKQVSKAISDAAERWKIPLDRVVLELTEQGAVHVRDDVLAAIESLRRLGIRFAFDDVGMAHSHLPVIERVRPAYLKVSQHFGTGFEADPTHLKLVRNLLSLANDFGAALILEGVESKATADAARQLGIPLGQGYYFARPGSAVEALQFLQNAKERK